MLYFCCCFQFNLTHPAVEMVFKVAGKNAITPAKIQFSQCIELTNGNLPHNLDASTLNTCTAQEDGLEVLRVRRYPVLKI